MARRQLALFAQRWDDTDLKPTGQRCRQAGTTQPCASTGRIEKPTHRRPPPRKSLASSI